VSVEPETLTIEIGGTETLKATVLSENADDKTVTWSSSAPAIVTVDTATGLATAVSEGEATIPATTADGNKTDDCTVTVYDPDSDVLRINNKMRLLHSAIDPGSRLLIYEMPEAQWNQALNATLDIRSISQEIYGEFEDDFDFVMCMLDNTDQTVSDEKYKAQAFAFSISNSVRGINQDIFNSSEWTNGGEKLKTFIFSTHNDTFAPPAQLVYHEIMHTWGIFVLSPEHFSGGHQTNYTFPGGQLGGMGFVRPAGENRYQMSPFETTNPDGSFAIPGFGMVHPIKYSSLELYLMGVKSAQELRDENFRVDVYLDPQDEGNGYFTASGIASYTIDDIIKNYGTRVPDVASSQKDFKMLTVILTPKGTPDSRFENIIKDMTWISGTENHPNYPTANMIPFSKIADGRATLETGGLKNSLR
jgi:hypothetical protein